MVDGRRMSKPYVPYGMERHRDRDRDMCDVRCEQEITCQSYNYVIKVKICELNNRTKEARPENFRSDTARFYIRHLNGRGVYLFFKAFHDMTNFVTK